MRLLGVHHVTAIAGDPQRNADFYVGLLGLRLVKKSVNQDDPGTYHLFYGDALGHPGTELTFFAWPGGQPGIKGIGQVVTVSLAIPPVALDYWARRLRSAGVNITGPFSRLGEDVLSFSDPDGLDLELVAGADTGHRALWSPWQDGPVPPEVAVRGVHAVTLKENRPDPTARFLTGTLGYRLAEEAEGRLRFRVGEGDSGAVLDLLPQVERRGRVAVGTVHHVAWRTPDAAEQQEWWTVLSALPVALSPIIDRFWFRSIYFREPGGVLFEIATDGPGFTVDEPAETLGGTLILPPWLEPQRAEIEAVLPPLRSAGQASSAAGGEEEAGRR